MSGELSVSISVNATKDDFTYNSDMNSPSMDALSVKKAGNPGMIDVSTTKGTSSFGSITSPRFVQFRNISTNVVEVTAGTTTHQIAYLRAGDCGGVPINSNFVLGHVSYDGAGLLEVKVVSE